jgi:hypothetical protein
VKARIEFFALRDDILPVLESVERQVALQYVLRGNFPVETLKVFSCGAKIPNLGRANSSSSVGCDAFLVTRAEATVSVEPIDTSEGKRYCVDQLLNADTVTFTPGGIWDDNVVLSGRVSTASDTPQARELMKLFHRALKKHFVRVNAFLVGPQALKLLDAGKRLTSGANAPTLYDLQR